MTFEYDFYEHLSVPDFILCKASKEQIGVIRCTAKNGDFKFNDINEITFTTYRYYDGELSPFYDQIQEMQYLLVPDFGRYIISSINTVSEGFDFEYKNCTAVSIQALLAQKYLDTFVINMGTVESIDGVQFYNIGDKSHSLLHLVLEKFPDWTIGHISPALMSQQRSFEVSLQDVYSFLTKDVAEAFECIFIFDTLNMTINVYQDSEYGEDTNISISYNNLLQQTNMESSIDDIKTCLTLTGYDNLNVREVNMGFDKIYNFEYFNSEQYFSHSLYVAYNAWITKYNSQLDIYNNLLQQYQNYYAQIYALEHEKMPSDPNSTNWNEYGLIPLQQKQSTYETLEATYMKSGWGNESSPYYSSKYLPNHQTIAAIKAQIQVVQQQLDALRSSQAAIGNQMTTIMNDVAIENNLSQDNLKELTKFIREEDLSTENYVVTDGMTDAERIDMLKNFLMYGQRELAKISQPQLSFSLNMANLFVIPEFRERSFRFDPGNYTYVTIREDYMIRARIISLSFDFYNPENFVVTFGNIMRLKGKDIFSDITESLNQAASAATSVSFNSSYWNKNSKKADDATKALSEGLIAAGSYLKSGDDSELVMDKRGFFVNTTSGQYAGKDSIYVGGGRILFTDDAWQTVSEAIGRVDIHGQSTFGVLANAMIAGYIQGSVIEATQMTTSTITATDINNGNGTFHVDANGNLLASSATITGTIKANDGYIGGPNGFTIQSQKMYSGKSALSDAANGVYIGTDGIALGANSVFKVTSDGTFYATKGYIGGTNGFAIEAQKMYSGKSALSDAANGVYIGTDGIALGANSVFKVTNQGFLTAQSGNIGGSVISSNSIHASNGNWYINSDGTASFKNVFITGVNAGSNFGSVGFDGSTTWGNFGGSSYFGSNVSTPFYGTTVSHIQSISADYINANYLTAMRADISDLYANKATVTALEAVSARVQAIEADYVTTGTLNAQIANVNQVIADNIKSVNATITNLDASWIKTGTLDADRINTSNLTIGHNNITGCIWQPIITNLYTTTISYVDSVGVGHSIDVVTSGRQINVKILDA